MRIVYLDFKHGIVHSTSNNIYYNNIPSAPPHSKGQEIELGEDKIRYTVKNIDRTLYQHASGLVEEFFVFVERI